MFTSLCLWDRKTSCLKSTMTFWCSLWQYLRWKQKLQKYLGGFGIWESFGWFLWNVIVLWSLHGERRLSKCSPRLYYYSDSSSVNISMPLQSRVCDPALWSRCSWFVTDLSLHQRMQSIKVREGLLLDSEDWAVWTIHMSNLLYSLVSTTLTRQT